MGRYQLHADTTSGQPRGCVAKWPLMLGKLQEAFLVGLTVCVEDTGQPGGLCQGLQKTQGSDFVVRAVTCLHTFLHSSCSLTAACMLQPMQVKS